jgi:site-specific DNA recombinase
MKDFELYQYTPEHYCAIYARRSSQKDKVNIDNQLQTCRNKAKALGLIISREYSDIESATKFEPLHREGFKQLVYDLKNNKFKTLIVFKGDRLARNIIHFKEIKFLCKQNNVRIVYAASDEENSDNDDELFSLMENIKISFSEIEAETIATRTKDGIDQKRASGKYPISGSGPMGYIKIGDGENAELKSDPKLSPAINCLFEHFSKGTLTRSSLKEIAEIVNVKFSLNLTTSDLINIIKKPIYAGWFTLKPNTPIDNLVIIDEENNLLIDTSQLIRATNVTPIIMEFSTWESTVTRYLYINSYSATNRESSTPSMFSGLLQCKKCHSAVYLIDNYFQCVNNCFKIKKEILLEKLLSDVIDDLLTQNEILAYYTIEMDKISSQVLIMEEKLKINNGKLDKLLLKMIKDKNINNPVFDDLVKEEEEFNTNYSMLKVKMSEYIYYKENLYQKLNKRCKIDLIQHLAQNENISSDFLKTIIKKVVIDVSKHKYCSEIQYHNGGIR